MIRSMIAALMLLAIAAFAIDWQRLLVPAGTNRTADAAIEGDVTQLKAQVDGDLVAVPIKDDSVVHRGDLLFVIDPREYQERVNRAAAEAAAAEAGVAFADAQLAQQADEIDVARAETLSADAVRVQAAEERTRQASLLNTESYFARDWQNALAADRGAAASVAGSHGALAAATTEVGVLKAQREGRRATLDAARAALALAEVQLGYTRILAPFDGRVTTRLVRLGDHVEVGAALISVVPLSGTWVIANVREGQLTSMAPGQDARVTIDSLPGIVLSGHVESIEANSQADSAVLPPDRAVGNFTKIVQRVPVKIVLDARPEVADRLRPGASAEIDISSSGSKR